MKFGRSPPQPAREWTHIPTTAGRPPVLQTWKDPPLHKSLIHTEVDVSSPHHPHPANSSFLRSFVPCLLPLRESRPPTARLCKRDLTPQPTGWSIVRTLQPAYSYTATI